MRAQIARSLDLEAIGSLEADIAVGPWLDGIEVAGRLAATVTRICGVSLDPFDEEVDEPIRLRLVPEGSPNAPRGDGSGLILISEEDPPEEAPGGTVDLAALLIEHLALGLSAFPRKPGVMFESPPESENPSAFAALVALKSSRDAV